jgi:hypothetical protein
MSNKFNLHKFLNENKLTEASRRLSEQKEEDFDGHLGLYLGNVGDTEVYSLEDSSINDTMFYGTIDHTGTKDVISIDVAGERISPEELKTQFSVENYPLLDFIIKDIYQELDTE